MSDPRDPAKPRTATPRTVIGTLPFGVAPSGPPSIAASPAPDAAPPAEPVRGSDPTAAMPVIPSAPPAVTPLPFVMPPPGPDPYLGSVIAERYRLERKLGEGGMGVVYLARHIVLEKPVAIKILAEDLARRPDLVQRFLHEAKAASRIHQENIVDITDFGQTPSGTVFFAMELLEGRDLATLIRREVGAVAWPRAKPILVQICRALAAAHQKGIIHRDMKPENVFLIEREGTSDFVKVLDFGIAKMTGMEEQAGNRLTRTGMIFGTPEYMSPEQAQGTHPDHRVDVYAVGVIMYEMLTGNVPFRADTFMGVLTKHMFTAPVPPSLARPEAGITPDLDAIVMRALEKDRTRRFQTMAELGQAIAATAGGAAIAFGSAGATAAALPGGESGALRLPAVAPGGPESTAVIGGPRVAPLAATALVAPAPAPVAPARSRAGLWIGLVTAALVLGGGAAVYLLALRPAGVAPAAPPKVEVAAPPGPGPVVGAAPADAGPRAVELTIRSRPPGAEVFRGPERLGLTPAKLSLPAGREEVVLSIRKTGFEERTLRLTPDREREFELDLTPVRRTGGGKRPPAGKAPEKAPKIPELKDPFSDG
ncbi:MAG TPA: serine/threonine-protein kinase [Polyangia bacterium]